MQINIVAPESDKRDHLQEIAAKLNVRFARIKERNPLGYLDQFESQFEALCMEVAGEMGGKFEHTGAGEPLFNFTHFGVASLGQ